MDGRYRLYFEDELLGIYDDLQGVVDEMLATIMPAMKEEMENDQRNNHQDSDEAVQTD